MFDGRKLICWDAKYKQTRSPSRADQYQIFSYSHLVSLNRISQQLPIKQVALVYPDTEFSRSVDYIRGPIREGNSEPSESGRDGQVLDVRLNILSMPFPMPTDLENDEQWNLYLNNLNAQTDRALFGKSNRLITFPTE